VLATFGIVDPIKLPDRLVRAFASLAARRPELVLALVGPISVELARELRTLGDELGVAERLVITGRVGTDAYLGWLDRTELAVQLRASFSGEASAAVGDCLACGLPMIVSDIGWLGELPDRAVLKVPVDVTSLELADACGRLLDDGSARRAFGKAARRYAESHTFNGAARVLLEVLAQPERSGRSTA